MSILQAIIFGIVEGITEFLPVSSTGHLILTADLLRLPSTEFQKSFEIIIQLGAILAVVVLYWRKLWQMQTIKKLLVAFLPTAVLGLALYKTIKHYLLGSSIVVLWSLLIGGLILIIFELYFANKQTALASSSISHENGDTIAQISYRQSFVIGLFQSIAMIPGVSRSAATIVGGLSLGLSRKVIVEFSFILAVPTMLAASALDIYQSADSFAGADYTALLVGFVISFIVALAVIKWLLMYIQKHSFFSFGIYRVVVAIFFWMILFKL